MVYSRRHDDILEIVIDNPPVNALAAGVRQSLIQLVAQGQDDARISAVVILGAGKSFSAGADISEFGRAPIDPPLRHVVEVIESSSKPIVAAIHGNTLGGGLEIALGCHFRIAAVGARLGLPEVTLGLLPGAGGTQRLPRLVGVEHALRMIALGDILTAGQALEIGLVDRTADQDRLREEGIAFARTLTAPRRTRDRLVSVAADVFAHFVNTNARKLKGLRAPMACIDAVRAAVELPFDQGQVRERALFQELLSSDQSKALRHVFFAQRAARTVDGLPSDIVPRTVERVGIVGAGTMGVGIAVNLLSAGIPVTIVEARRCALGHGVEMIRQHYATSVAKGRLTEQQAMRTINRLVSSLDYEAFRNCDLIIEAAYEDIAVKKAIFARLEGVARHGAMLASNTSYLSIDEIADTTKRPQDVIGLHFFSPANLMTLLEVVRGRETASDVLATAMRLAHRIGKVSVVAGVCHGFIGNRMLIARRTNADRLLLEGATLEQIDKVHTEFGMPMGPFQMTDLAGVDIGWHRDPTRIETTRDALCAEGRWGQKTGAGYYDYDTERRPARSARVSEIVDVFRQQAGIEPRQIADEEIVVRTLYTLVNEGAKILEERIAQRASDIDVVWVHGYGWPRHTGGPMFWASRIGLHSIVRGLESHADRLGPGFTISPLLRQKADNGDTFEARMMGSKARRAG